jgi:CRP-like cAMP-binding protein
LKDHFHISESDWKLIKDYFETTLVNRNEYFIKKGRVCHRMGFVAEGVLRYTMIKDNEKEVTCNFTWEDNFVGDPDSFISQKPSEITLQAVTNCRLTTFSFPSYKLLFKVYPRFGEITNSIDHISLMNLLEQKTFLMNNDAASRYSFFVQHYSHLLQRVPLGYIASFLDITQQSLSRLRKQLS